MKTSTIVNVNKVALLAALVLNVSLLAAAETGGGAWWPQFHGPNRDNMSSETGLLKQWPHGGPKLIWKASQCGDGYSMVSIAHGMIFTAGDFGDEEMVIALDMDGRLLWKSPNGRSWTGAYPGSRTTPTYDDGTLYHMNPTGRLTALEAASGKAIWSVDLRSRFGGRYGTWAMAENVAVEDEKVLCVPGGTRGLVAALDKHTGETIWANTELNEVAAYCSPIVVTYGGLRQMIALTQKSVISVDVDTGELLWSYPHVTPHDQNINTPVVNDGHVFVASGHLGGGRLLKINADLHGVTEVWSQRRLDNCHGGVILIDGCLYGSACRSGGKAFFCVDFLTGETRQSDRTLGKLSLTFAEGMLYGLSDKGEMLLLKTTPGGFSVVGKFRVPREGDTMYLSHPVICGGRLYIRHGGNLYAYDVSAG